MSRPFPRLASHAGWQGVSLVVREIWATSIRASGVMQTLNKVERRATHAQIAASSRFSCVTYSKNEARKHSCLEA